MDEKKLKNTSRYLAALLRHKPEKEELAIDSQGWTSVEILLDRLNLTLPELEWIVENNNKSRFAFNEDKTEIRASQGHSLDWVNIEYEEIGPEHRVLYHGTGRNVVDKILKEGLKPMNRTHVHMSGDEETAWNVGKRKDKNVAMFAVNAAAMRANGIKIYKSANGVFLCKENIHPDYLTLIAE